MISKQIGLVLAKPECNIPARTFLNVENGQAILSVCAMHKMAYIWGLLVVLTLVLMIGAIWTHRYSGSENPRYHFYVPPWVVPIPLLFGVLYTSGAYRSTDVLWASENLEFSLSDMSKKEFLNFKVGDDRTDKNFLASATSATILTGSALLGPFLRGDR